MGTPLNPLFVTVGANIAGFVTGMAKVQARTIATQKVIQSASKLAGFALVGLGVIVAVKLAGSFIKAAESIQKALAIIRRGTGATGKSLQVLKKDFDAVFGTVPEDAEQVATAIADLNTRLELTGRPLQRMSRLFLDFARIAGEDVGETIRRTTRVFGDWSVATERQEDVMNLLLRASQNSGVAITELSTKLVQFGAPLRQVGFTLEESVALLAKWEKEGVNVEAILGSLKISIGRFATAGEDAGEAFKRALTDITEVETEAEAAAIALDTVGSRAMADFAAAVREGRFDIEDFQKALEENTDTIKDAAKESETTADRIATAFNKIEASFAPLGEQLIPVLEGGAFALGIVAENVNLVVAAFTTLVGLKVASLLGVWSTALQTLGQGATVASVAVGLLQGAVLGFVLGQAFKAVIEFFESKNLREALQGLRDVTIGGELLRSLSDLRSRSKKELEGLVDDVAAEMKRLRAEVRKEQKLLDSMLAVGGNVFAAAIDKSTKKVDEMRSRLGFLGRRLVDVTKAFENATDAVGGPGGGGDTLTSAFIQFSGAAREAGRDTQQLEADLADLALKMSRVRDFFFDFTGMIDPRALGGPLSAFRGLTDIFGKDLPLAFVKGWNLIVRPALFETVEEAAARLAKEAQQELRARVTIGLIDAFSDAFKGNLAFEDFLDAFRRGLKNVFTFVIQDAAKFMAEMIGGIKGELAAFAVTFGGQLIGALQQRGGALSVLGSTAQGAIVGGQAGGPPGAIIGGFLGLIGGLMALDKFIDLGLPTFAEAQAILAQRALEAAEALANVKDVIADTNVSIFRAKLSLDQFRDSLQEARKAERDAARAIRAEGTKFKISTGRPSEFVGFGAGFDIEAEGVKAGGPALKELQRLITEAATGTGRKLDFISRKEQKEILDLVMGEQNKILAAQLIEAAAARRLIEVDFQLQKLHLENLKKTRISARETLKEMTSVVDAIGSSKDAIVDAIRDIPVHQKGIDFVPQTGLAIVHRGEQIIPARGERGAAGIDAGGGRPTSLTANIFLDGKLVESVVVPVMEDAIASRETSIRVNTRERRG